MSHQNKKTPLADTKTNLNSAGRVNLTSSTLKENCLDFQVLASPLQSESDKKEYKVIKLKNGLTACLISDKSTADTNHPSESESDSGSDTESDNSDDCSNSSGITDDSMSGELKNLSTSIEQKMAAAGLCVGVGSFSDPKEVPGMAHFLEHMVFMGSEKFPAENDFDSFIKKGGGSDNASTDAETTCFYFECLEKNLYRALDKFAQFFISPLMKKGAMAREREAIESEFQIALPSDSSRKEQLLCSFANPESPVNSFSWGNLKTLRDNISDDKLYEGVHEFRKRHYSAHRMTLAIQARLPMETLQRCVLECFSRVPSNDLPPDDFSNFADGIFETPQFKRMYYIKPTKDLCQVDLTWSLPSLQDKYKTKPHQYLSFLIGDEGKGSILSYLRKKVWALATSVGNGESGAEHNSMYTLFTVTIVLTEDGLKNLFCVIDVLYSYINMLQTIGPQERIFNEIKMISNTSFRFASEQTAVDLVEELCESMQLYPSEDYLAGSEIYYEYDPEAISMVTSLLRPENMNIMVMSKTLPDDLQFDKVEKWFGTEYTDTEIADKWINRWQNVMPYQDLNVPSANPYLTTDFTILPESGQLPDYPNKLIKTPLLELWYRRDQKFKLPVAYYYMYLITPKALDSPSSSAMLDMFINLLVVSVTEELYPATSADLSYSFVTHEKGMIVKIYGYNENLPSNRWASCLEVTVAVKMLSNVSTVRSLDGYTSIHLLLYIVVVTIWNQYLITEWQFGPDVVVHIVALLMEVISKYLTTFSNHITESMFEAVKDKVVKSYYNKLLKPSSLAKDIRLNLLVDNYWTPIEKYLALLNLKFDHVVQFSKEFMKELYVKALVQGNVLPETATDTVNKFVQNLGYVQLPENSYPKFRVAQVPKGEKCCRLQGFNVTDSNSIITNYYQCGPFSIRSSVIIEIIMMIIEEPLFDVLRTKEQLGYHVYCSMRDTFGILGYTLTVNTQATKFTSSFIDGRIEEFLKHTQKLLTDITESELEQIKEDLTKTKQCSDVHLKEEIDRNWSEIASDDYLFDRLKQEIDTIRDVGVQEIREWWDKHNIFGSKENFRKLSVQVVGSDQKEKSPVQNEVSSGEDHGDSPAVGNLKINVLGTTETCKAENKPEDYFIVNIETFKDNLYLYPTVVHQQ